MGGPGVLSSPWVRRAILPIAFALALAGAIELTIELLFHPSFWERTTYLMHDPYRGELFDRDELAIRLSNVEDSEPDIISVGDSAGFFSLQPTIINRYLGGWKYVDLNTGGNHAYDGYYAITEYMLRRSHHVKYVVLYIFPELLPQRKVFSVSGLGTILKSDLISLKAALLPPSTFLSPYLKFLLFEGRQFHRGDPLGNTVPLDQLTSTVTAAEGWLPEFDVRYDRIGGHGSFYQDRRPGLLAALGLVEPSSIVAYLEYFDRMVRSHGAQLAIAFAPMPARFLDPYDPNVVIADRALARFQREQPDVKFLFPLLTPWGPEKFGMFNHISREYTFLSSERLAEGLARLIQRPDTIAPYIAQVPEHRLAYPAMTVTPTGPPNPKLLDAALAYYRYTTLTDPADWQLVSSRVQKALEADPAFVDMMTDAKSRTEMLAGRNIRIGLDMSQLHATPVAVNGVPFCDPRPDVEWVQIDGAMIFTFDSPVEAPREPVAWPHNSGILIPTIVEDGVRKFDGYCPEPSMAAVKLTPR